MPEGWLYKQLLIQAKGLNGNLDKVWPDIRDSKWIGGSAEGWERVPYWLDGFIPLAWLLRDEDMQKRARTYIDAILERQEEDGWICPCGRQERHGYDVWAVFLICKVLTVYGDCSGDKRVEPAIEKALRNLNRHIETDTLFNWGMCRWYECLIPIYWLYERKPKDWLLQLAAKLQAEGLSYKKLFENWQFTEPVKQGGELSHPCGESRHGIKIRGVSGKNRRKRRHTTPFPPLSHRTCGLISTTSRPIRRSAHTFQRTILCSRQTAGNPIYSALSPISGAVPQTSARAFPSSLYPAFALERHPIGEMPFSPEEPPVSLYTDLCEIDWRMENGICKAEPENRKPLGADQRKKPIPYGCTNLRMTEMPLADGSESIEQKEKKA